MQLDKLEDALTSFEAELLQECFARKDTVWILKNSLHSISASNALGRRPLSSFFFNSSPSAGCASSRFAMHLCAAEQGTL